MADVIKTIGGTTPDYATFTLFEAAVPADITAATGTDEHWIGKGRDALFSEDFAVSGITTDATNRVTLTYDTGAATTGIARSAGGSGCTISGNNAGGVVRSAVQHLTIDGLDLVTTSGPALIGLQNASYVAGNDTIIKNCVLHGTTSSSSAFLINASKATLDITLENCIGYSGARFIDTRNSATAKISYCTIFQQADQLGIVSDTELTCKNTYVGRASGSAEDFWTGGAAPSGNNNASSDSTATIDYTSSITSIVAADQFVSTTTSSEDFTLKASSDLEGAGANISGITTDIIGTTRDVTTPDIGAFEFVSAGGNTLTADSGSYSYTGTAAELQRGLIMSADSGSYTYTGTAADLTFTPVGNFTLTADTGAYTYTGTTADLLKGSNLSADSGSYTYTGTAATLTFAAAGSFTLTADSGTYSYNGTNASLIADRILTADSGSYSYTGTAADLLKGFSLTAESGAYSYTGTSIGFVEQRILNALSGSYVYNGTNANLIFTPVAPDVPVADGVTVSGTFGNGVAFTASFGNGVTTKGKL